MYYTLYYNTFFCIIKGAYTPLYGVGVRVGHKTWV